MLSSVLFVDDDDDLREAMQAILERLSVARVVAARSLRDVMDKRDEALACELAFLDINLGAGEPTGVEICEWLRREGFAGRIVFLTGHASNDPRVREAAGVAQSQIASKPVSVSTLRELLDATRRPL